MRQSPEDIDRAILDVAAGIFARHGFAHTSVQQVADAVGYSKPGLLHRFGSKDALHRAVLTEAAGTVEELRAAASVRDGGPDHLARSLRLVVERALDRPGILQLLVALLRPDSAEPGAQAVQAAGRQLLEDLLRAAGAPRADGPASEPADLLRALLALDLVVTATAVQHSRRSGGLRVERPELVPLLLTLAAQVIGPVGGAPAT